MSCLLASQGALFASVQRSLVCIYLSCLYVLLVYLVCVCVCVCVNSVSSSCSKMVEDFGPGLMIRNLLPKPLKRHSFTAHQPRNSALLCCTHTRTRTRARTHHAKHVLCVLGLESLHRADAVQQRALFFCGNDALSRD